MKLSLVTCAVTLTPATTESEKVRFHTLNRKTGDRIYTRYVDAVSGKTVDKDAQVKAYEKGEDDYVILEDKELAAVQLESARTIDIEEFVPTDSIEWVYYDSPYFLVPADEVGEEAFIVIREAMAKAGVAGISRLVIGGRERAVMLEPDGNGIVLWTLRFGDEVRDEKEYWDKIEDSPVDKKMLAMVEALVEKKTTKWSESLVEDPVRAELLRMIKSKKPRGRKAASKEADGEAERGNVIDLFSALKKSLEAGKSTAKGEGRT